MSSIATPHPVKWILETSGHQISAAWIGGPGKHSPYHIQDIPRGRKWLRCGIWMAIGGDFPLGEKREKLLCKAAVDIHRPGKLGVRGRFSDKRQVVAQRGSVAL